MKRESGSRRCLSRAIARRRSCGGSDAPRPAKTSGASALLGVLRGTGSREMATLRARLVPLYLTSPDDPEFVSHTERLAVLLADEAELMAPLALGSALPEADAVVFPQMVGEAYRRVDDFRGLDLPVLVLTSDFGTMAMWDWEIISYLRAEGVNVMAPYSLDG